MKKSLIALAALAAVGTVSAQSSVTLYGRMDLGMLVTKTEQGTRTVKTTSLAGAEGTRTGNRLGVRGTEDLGGGLRANFNIETAVNIDRTVPASTFGKVRTAILQLQGGFGSATIGTYLNTFDDVRGVSVATAGVAGGDFLAKSFGDNIRGLGPRSENAIGYRSPSFGGLDFRIGTTYEKAETNVVTATNPTGLNLTTKTTGYIGGIGYNNGPISALLALGQGKLSTPAGNGKVNDVAFVASYNLGVAVPYIQLESAKGTNTAVVGEVKTTGYELGAKFPLGAFTPHISVSGGKIKTTPTGLATTEVKTRGFQLGTTYDLSKRTYVYAAAGREKNLAAPLAGGTGDVKGTGFGLGLVHNF
ncbi:porin [Polaromonas sp.]|uniref:porin n=1 Tax=Polaromonas sp. TaxID=1869339 RepID=UPI00286ACE12|nr:porin [Polaromonas sp.]